MAKVGRYRFEMVDGESFACDLLYTLDMCYIVDMGGSMRLVSRTYVRSCKRLD